MGSFPLFTPTSIFQELIGLKGGELSKFYTRVQARDSLGGSLGLLPGLSTADPLTTNPKGGRPWRLTLWFLGTFYLLLCPSGTLRDTGVIPAGCQSGCQFKRCTFAPALTLAYLLGLD